jgi:hypothetical protein
MQDSSMCNRAIIAATCGRVIGLAFLFQSPRETIYFERKKFDRMNRIDRI